MKIKYDYFDVVAYRNAVEKASDKEVNSFDYIVERVGEVICYIESLDYFLVCDDLTRKFSKVPTSECIRVEEEKPKRKRKNNEDEKKTTERKTN